MKRAANRIAMVVVKVALGGRFAALFGGNACRELRIALSKEHKFGRKLPSYGE